MLRGLLLLFYFFFVGVGWGRGWGGGGGELGGMHYLPLKSKVI